MRPVWGHGAWCMGHIDSQIYMPSIFLSEGNETLVSPQRPPLCAVVSAQGAVAACEETKRTATGGRQSEHLDRTGEAGEPVPRGAGGGKGGAGSTITELQELVSRIPAALARRSSRFVYLDHINGRVGPLPLPLWPATHT